MIKIIYGIWHEIVFFKNNSSSLVSNLKYHITTHQAPDESLVKMDHLKCFTPITLYEGQNDDGRTSTTIK